MKKPFMLFFFLSLFFAHAEEVYWQQVAKGYDKPVDLVPLPTLKGEDGLFLVVEQTGKVFLTDFQGRNEKVLDWTKKITSEKNEQGFFKIVLAPDFTDSGISYFNLTNPKGNTEIWRYTFNLEDLSKCAKADEMILEIPQHRWNHNGGWMDFGPDGMLYIPTGDGGGGHDDAGKARDMSSLLGKILRIDVSGGNGYKIPADNPYLDDASVRDEIYAFGLRNPWRCAWHGDVLYIADVGQKTWEEINAVKLKDLKGADFGWRVREGLVKTPSGKYGAEMPLGAINPVYVYGRKPEKGDDLSGNSITGGIVYNGKISSLKGRYFFADYAQPKVWSFRLNEQGQAEDRLSHAETIKADIGNLHLISSFSAGHDGEMYVISHAGKIFKLAERE